MLYLENGNKNVWVYGKVLNLRNYVDRSLYSLEIMLHEGKQPYGELKMLLQVNKR
jgi:hypothetical protein